MCYELCVSKHVVAVAMYRCVYRFSGSGHMDLGIGMWLKTIDAAAFIIDCDWNMNAPEVRHAILNLCIC
jgi:hypothetical protein